MTQAERLRAITDRLLGRMEDDGSPESAKDLSEALLNVLRASATAHELDTRQPDRLPVEVANLQRITGVLLAWLDDLQDEFERNENPASRRVAARIRSAVRDVLPDWEPRQR